MTKTKSLQEILFLPLHRLDDLSLAFCIFESGEKDTSSVYVSGFVFQFVKFQMIIPSTGAIQEPYRDTVVTHLSCGFSAQLGTCLGPAPSQRATLTSASDVCVFRPSHEPSEELRLLQLCVPGRGVVSS